MDSSDVKDKHFSFPEFQYTNTKDQSPMPDGSANQPQPDNDRTIPRIPVLCPRFPIRLRVLTQLGSVLSLAIVSLRALLVFGWLLNFNVAPWMGPLQRVVIFDKIIIGTFVSIWYMRFLVQIWEADLVFSKAEAAAQGDAQAKADIEALEKKRDWNMLFKHRPYNVSWVFGARK
ncbi:hypothetical protein CEP54_007115 [Fusarium duplospermum]|uniref:Uncharacterized protein n=1 Tax=Fusarium duplospermum TaxID=1325734 RepID=A0A428Q3C4_9HYPO|nr:hypothetical protein CEP54_007115 [Fusarium duplospermum]